MQRLIVLVLVYLLTSPVAWAGDLLDAIRRNQAAQAQCDQPDFQPTPISQLKIVLAKLNLKSTDVLVDYGCGDGRALVLAASQYGCRGIGIEIDPDQAKLATEFVEAAGLSKKIKIVEGDATKLKAQANKAFVYLWPETLEALAPKLKDMDAIASYQHAVPGLEMIRDGEAWYRLPEKTAKSIQYERQWVITGYRNVKYCNGKRCWYQREPIYGWKSIPVKQPAKKTEKPVVRKTAATRYGYWNGRAYTGRVCNSPNCSMCNSIAAQLGFR